MSESGSPSAIESSRKWYKAIGPGLITACVVIGPGSILTSSNVGARQGYSMAWVVITSVIFMLVFMTMGARLGVATGQSAASIITRRAGRW
ncbi:MAG: divalent metal cation transporter, partial [Pirellulaceae bacterium]|nr:divalent metal cation transporter [Pirellulaceae bacterium]